MEIKLLPSFKPETVPEPIDEFVQERAYPEVPSVACHLIPDLGILDQRKNILDLNIVRTHFINGGRLSLSQAHKILYDSSLILREEKNVVRINKKAYIIGDTHGQFYDLVSFLSNFDLNEDILVFLGDYVDRGVFSSEVYLYLLLLKLYYPNNIILLRGNHESQKMTTYFTFKNECEIKYDEETYEKFLKSFMNLPLVAVIQDKAYCCHGGISPSIKKISDIDKINRFCEVDYQGVMCDILWADPAKDFDNDDPSWMPNDKRRCSYFYNSTHLKNFFNENSIEMIFRAHEVQKEGFSMHKDRYDMLLGVTVFSAPNYCDIYENMGAIIEFDEKINAIHQFPAAPHPYVLKGYIDGISWSLPFVFEKALELSVGLISILNDLDLGSSSSTEEVLNKIDEDIEDTLNKTIEDIKVPISIMRSERENIDEIPDDEESTVNDCALEANESEVVGFSDASKKDAFNEIKKEDEGVSGQTIDISPSCQRSLLDEMGEPSKKEAEQNKEMSVNNPNNRARVARRKSWLCALCLG